MPPEGLGRNRVSALVVPSRMLDWPGFLERPAAI
jgi:hypothetical protein